MNGTLSTTIEEEPIPFPSEEEIIALAREYVESREKILVPYREKQRKEVARKENPENHSHCPRNEN